MKQPKRPTREQKQIISKNRLNAAHWMIVEDAGEEIKIFNKSSGNIRTIRR